MHNVSVTFHLFAFMKIEPIILEGEFVRLEPLKIEHADALCEVGLVEEIWLWTTNIVCTKDEMRRYIETALDEFNRKVSLPFVTVEKTSNKIVGSTRFGNIDAKNHRAEIGWTWINPAWQRISINTEAKLLMLTHAFETWKCIRVELKTDVLNEKSRKAILRVCLIFQEANCLSIKRIIAKWIKALETSTFSS